MKLAALLFLKLGESHGMYKLFGDGSRAPVEAGCETVAVEWAEQHGYKCDGAWLHEAPALVWAPSWVHFEAAWGRPALRAPVRFSRRGRGYAVGRAGYMITAWRREDIQRLRQEYLYLGGVDISMLPVSELIRRNDQARRRLAEQTRTLANGRDHGNLVALRVR